MPHRCCVPYCRGNYENGPKVSIYSFPKDEEYKNKWIASIQRKNFKPTASSKVCERHFTENDFETVTSGFDSAKGILIVVPLKVKKLKKHVVPTVFPDHPKCNSVPMPIKLTPNFKKQKTEKISLQGMQDLKNEKKIYTLDDIGRCASKFGISKDWTIMMGNTRISFFNIAYEPAPSITRSLVIDANLNASAFLHHIELKEVGDKYHLPFKISSFIDVENMLKEITLLKENTEQSLKIKVRLIDDALDDINTEDNEMIISFIKEQLHLLTCSKRNVRYSSQLIAFTSILHAMSPSAYNFLRECGHFNVPHPSTLKSACRSLSDSSELEQCDEQILLDA